MTTAKPFHRAILFWYYLAVYLALCWINFGNLDLSSAKDTGSGASLFLLNAYASYNAMYLFPALLLTWLAGRHRLWRLVRAPRLAPVAAEVVAVVAGALTTLFFYANTQLHALYGMFVNGFVINLIVTPGGIESLGGSGASSLGFVLIALGFLVAHVVLMLVIRWWFANGRQHLHLPRRFAMVLGVVFVVSTVSDRGIYAYGNAVGHNDMLVLTQGVPYYVSTTARSFFHKLGYRLAPQDKQVNLKGLLHYPAHPIQFTKPVKPYNIVWLVSESWRADMLDPEIMPNTAAFAAQAQNFKLHYSGGNGTRVGVFTMMTGVPGSYWQAFYESHRSAPMIDVLQKQGYQMSFYTSAKFSYPEFDQTIFSKVPPSQLHTINTGQQGWEKDRKNVTDLLDFIDKRDPSKPFFTFMFFESPHARYYFPPESVIRRPYRDDINYATLDQNNLREDIGPIKNRYINAVHHLDSQFGRVFDYLKSHGLLENTIVVALGDHGEEFMEDGYWGHNSTFSDPQTRTPLVVWMPGRAPATYDKLTSHLDLVPTIMPLLGVTNPTSDYSSGINLFSKEQHEYIILSDWSHVGFKDSQVKITLPVSQGAIGKKIVGPHDEKLTSAQAQSLFRGEQKNLVDMMQELGRYTRRH